jgi:acyl-CoA synthetase (AMP-forming)/AMP-acid ligase II
VENAFYADKRVAEAAAIGVPDERLGELVGVIVSLHPSASGKVQEKDLLESVKPR